MFKILILFSLIISSSFALSNQELKDKYDYGDSESGYKLAERLFDNKEYIESSKILTDLMLLGYPESFTKLGVFFELGLEIESNCRKATTFYLGGISAGDCNGFLELERMAKTGSCLNSKKPALVKKFREGYNKCLIKKKN